MHLSIEIARKIALAYDIACKPVCRALNLPKTAFDILMFLGNNPTYKTASEIVEVRHIKANLVSVNVEQLVQKGYLVRQPMEGDRRKTALYCTEKAEAVIERGRECQNAFFEQLFSDVDETTRRTFFDTMQKLEESLDAFLKDAEE